MNDTTKTPHERILVVGDLTLDWLEQTIPRTEQRTADDRRNYELYNPGFRWSAVWGGTALLQRLVAAVTDKSRIRVEEIKFPEYDSAEARRCVASLALIKPMPTDGAKKGEVSPVRVSQFKGFSGGYGDQQGNVFSSATLIPSADKTIPLTCLVIDDAANACRWDHEFIEKVQNHAINAKNIVIKLTRPLNPNPLLDKLLKIAEEKIVVITNADDLRAEGVDLSRRLSWERTAYDVVTATGGHEILRKLSSIKALIVRLGSDGCTILTPTAKYLVFDPKGSEEAFADRLDGKMPGATSAFVAIVSSRLAEGNTDLVKITRSGLAASRKLLEAGFKEQAPADPPSDANAGKAQRGAPYAPLKEPGYPDDVFSNLEPVADVFRSRELPAGAILDKDFSILTELLREPNEDGESLPERVVYYGPTQLSDVPTAEYGKLLLVDRGEVEGYRSIENLIREYIKMTEIEQQKPLSIGVFGPPGSGKSFGIKQLAEHIDAKRIRIRTLNLTQLQQPSDLVGVFHSARDDSLRRCLPLLIFDEFDCAFGDRWGWLKYFLAPMQDGEFKDQALIHPFGSAIFVFAGGIATCYEDFNVTDPGAAAERVVDSPNKPGMEQEPEGKSNSEAKSSSKADKKSPEEKRDEYLRFKAAKGPDFVSRLKGYLNVKGISGHDDDDTCVVRRAVLIRSLLEKDERTANLFRMIENNKELQIDDVALHAFLNVKKYNHGARSLESILAMSRLTGADRFAAATLPSDEQLLLHVDSSFINELRARLQSR